MEIVTININMSVLKRLHSLGLTSSDYEVKIVDEPQDYSSDETWCILKTESRKAYKALKKREFELRHK
jgi:hypothetical protein